MSEIEEPHPYCELCVDGGAIATLAELEPLVTGRQELLELRRRLKFDDAGRFTLASGHRLRRALLLERVCRRLIAEHGMPAGPFVAVGDLPPETPDDLSGLDEGDTPE